MPFSANFVKITSRDGKLLVEGLSDADDVNRIDSMQIAIDAIGHANGNGGTQMQAVPVGDIEGSGDWVVEVSYPNGSSPAVGTSMLVAGATTFKPSNGATDSPFFWFQTLPVEQ
jgi:hypothetical protein